MGHLGEMTPDHLERLEVAYEAANIRLDAFYQLSDDLRHQDRCLLLLDVLDDAYIAGDVDRLERAGLTSD